MSKDELSIEHGTLYHPNTLEMSRVLHKICFVPEMIVTHFYPTTPDFIVPFASSKSDLFVTIMAVGITSTRNAPMLNFSGYYHKRTSSVDLSQSTAWLEHLQLNLCTVNNTHANGKSSKVQYQVQATYTPPCCQDPELVWTVSRPFDDFRRFRKQLMRDLQNGHACPAECKWLYTVIKNHFPKPNLLPIYSSRVVETRRQSLIRLLRTLQASLINRGNQGCKVLVQSVCRAFTTFMVGDNTQLPDMMMRLSDCSSGQSSRASATSFTSSGCSDEECCSKDVSPARRFEMQKRHDTQELFIYR
ncbi:unnamed protein product [Peronospora belbahrii]|uniref:PX domain-containing protein n=1 Tax=Peronospora belbahrii TaxID=622444 RepID=A0AAU9L849_9STRA|nr:unnamed protein product [Peronospora belbahrii]